MYYRKVCKRNEIMKKERPKGKKGKGRKKEKERRKKGRLRGRGGGGRGALLSNGQSLSPLVSGFLLCSCLELSSVVISLQFFLFSISGCGCTSNQLSPQMSSSKTSAHSRAHTWNQPSHIRGVQRGRIFHNCWNTTAVVPSCIPLLASLYPQTYHITVFGKETRWYPQNQTCYSNDVLVLPSALFLLKSRVVVSVGSGLCFWLAVGNCGGRSSDHCGAAST